MGVVKQQRGRKGVRGWEGCGEEGRWKALGRFDCQVWPKDVPQTLSGKTKSLRCQRTEFGSRPIGSVGSTPEALTEGFCLPGAVLSTSIQSLSGSVVLALKSPPS